MKKLLTLLLTLSLLLGLSLPAAAAGSGMNNFKKTETYGNQFTDVAASYWAASSIKTCYEYGLMQGYGADSFVPKGDLTVAQAIVMADRVHEIYTTGQSTLTNGTPWYQPYVDYAMENGIIQADDFTDYNAKVTRAQMAYIFCNALLGSELSAINPIQSIPDVDSDHPYAAKILALYQAGVLTGSDIYGTFKPNDNILRAEAAAIIARVAIPAQRQSMTLLKDYTWDGVTVPLPTDVVVDTSSDLYSLLSASTGTMAMFSRETSVAYSDTDITILSPDQMNQVIQEGMAEEGVTISGLSSQLVTFGAMKAYRTSGTLTMDGEPMNAVIYTYITDNTMYMICLLAYQNDTVLKNMADGLRVGGAAAKEVTTSTSTGTTSKPGTTTDTTTTTKPSTGTSTSNGNTSNTGSGSSSSGGSTSTVKPTQNTVYVTPTGKRYHYSKDCAGKNGTAVTLQNAQSRGFTPCAKCVG